MRVAGEVEAFTAKKLIDIDYAGKVEEKKAKKPLPVYQQMVTHFTLFHYLVLVLHIEDKAHRRCDAPASSG
jgi:hypothetical protein